MATLPIEVHHMVDYMLFGEDPTLLFPLDCHFDRKHIMASSCEAKSKILNASDWFNFNDLKAKERMQPKSDFLDQATDVDTIKKAFWAESHIGCPQVAVVISYFWFFFIKNFVLVADGKLENQKTLFSGELACNLPFSISEFLSKCFL